MSRDTTYAYERKRGDASPIPDAEIPLTPPVPSSTTYPDNNNHHHKGGMSPSSREGGGSLWPWSSYFSPDSNTYDKSNTNTVLNSSDSPPPPSYLQQWYARVVILPNNKYRKLWEFWSAVVILYTSVAVPFIVFFNIHFESDSSLYIWETIVYISFIIDLVLAFFSARIGSEGQLITDPKLITVHYLRTWFIIDAIAILPFQFLSAETVGEGTSTSFTRLTRIPRMLQLLRLVRLAKVFGLMRVIARVLKQNLTPAYSRLSMTVLGSLIMIHVLTCLWWFVGSENLMSGLPNWIETKGLEHTSLSDAYLTSMYYILCTISTLGPGDIVPVHFNERVYAILLIGIGSVWFGTIVYSVSAFLEEVEQANRVAYDKRRHLLAFARHHKLDSVLTSRMVASFDTVSAKRAAADTDGMADDSGEMFGVKMDYNADLVLSSVSPEMREELILAAKRKELERFPALQNQPKRVQAYILQHLHEAVALDGEIIGAEGDHAEYMYFIASGKVDLTLEGKIIASYGQGAIIGEIDCMFSTSRIATIQANGKCNYFTLSREHLHHICERIPEFSDWLHIIAAHRVQQYENVSKTRLPVSDQLHTVINEFASPELKGRNGSIVGIGKLSRAHSSSLTDALGSTGSETGSVSDISHTNTIDPMNNSNDKSSFILGNSGLPRGNSKRAAVAARANPNNQTIPTPEIAPWAALEKSNRKTITPASSGMDGIEPLRTIQANHEMRAMGSVTALTFALSNMFAGGVGNTSSNRNTLNFNRRPSKNIPLPNNNNSNSKVSILEMMSTNNRKNVDNKPNSNGGGSSSSTYLGPELTDTNIHDVPVINLPPISTSSTTVGGTRPPFARFLQTTNSTTTGSGSTKSINGRSAPSTPSLTGQTSVPTIGNNTSSSSSSGIFTISPGSTMVVPSLTNIPRNESGSNLTAIIVPKDIVVSIPLEKPTPHVTSSLGYQRHTASGFIPSEGQIPELSLEEMSTPIVKLENDASVKTKDSEEK